MKIKQMREAVKEIQQTLIQVEEDGSVTDTPLGRTFKINGYKLTTAQMDNVLAQLKTLAAQLAASTPWDL